MPVDTAAGLTNALRRHRLLKPAQLDELDRLQASFPTPHALAGELVRRDWLTPYQVNQLLQDHGRDLLLGSYVLLEPLGEGGMGEVFKARNWKLGQIVALKLIRKERLDNPDAVRRFHREIRAAAQLDHPHIVRALDADEVGGTHLLVMDYIQGTDLAKLVKKDGPLPVDKACDYCRQAAMGLQHACERGLVHRDIKPHNLMLTVDGVVKILDMGLARLDRRTADEASSTMTSEGAVMGTLDYISPEQAMDSHDVDIRADLYSLGCTLYFLLTGSVPFPGGEALQKLLKHRLDEPVPVEQLRRDVPPAVAAVVRKLMAKRPEDRYQTPAEAAAALASAELAEASPTAPAVTGAVGATGDATGSWSSMVAARRTDQTTTVPQRRRRTAPGRSWIWLGAAIGVAILATGLTGLFWFLPRGANPPPSGAPLPPSVARPVAPLATQAKTTNSIGMELARIAPGTFLMGSPNDEAGRVGDEGPQHMVEITRPFYLGVYPVTKGQFAAFVSDDLYQTEAEKAAGTNSWRNPGFNLRYNQTDDDPVVYVTRDDAVMFCEWLRKKEKKTYELPTEAEWEYACRAGTTTAYSFGADAGALGDYAWFDGNSGGHTHQVGGKKSSPWGLYDMHGNVWQWCNDPGGPYADAYITDPKFPYSAESGIVRGGSWLKNAGNCRSAMRLHCAPGFRSSDVGFRVVCRVPGGQ